MMDELSDEAETFDPNEVRSVAAFNELMVAKCHGYRLVRVPGHGFMVTYIAAPEYAPDEGDSMWPIRERNEGVAARMAACLVFGLVAGPSNAMFIDAYRKAAKAAAAERAAGVAPHAPWRGTTPSVDWPV